MHLLPFLSHFNLVPRVFSALKIAAGRVKTLVSLRSFLLIQMRPTPLSDKTTHALTYFLTFLLLFYFIIFLLIYLFFYLQIASSTYTTILTLFTLEYLRYLQNNIFTTVLTNMILKLLTKQFLHYLQCSDYTTTDKVTAPNFCYSTITEIHNRSKHFT